MAVAGRSGFQTESRMLPWFRGLTLVTAISAFALVVIGGIVRVTGSGLGCPDWPLCHGGVLPPWETLAIIEYSHRIVASLIVGPLVVAVVAVAWISFRRERWVVIPATFTLLLLFGQAILGGVTVKTELPGAIVTGHLALGEALLACLILIAVVAYRGPLRLFGNGSSGNAPRFFPLLIIAAAVGIYGILISGSIVTATNSTAGCLDWPLCNGDFFPDQRQAGIHMGHRLLVTIVGVFVLFVLRLGIRQKRLRPDIGQLSVAVAALFAAQVVAGAAIIWLDFSDEVRGLHLAAATAVWGTIALLALITFTANQLPVATQSTSPSEEPVHA